MKLRFWGVRWSHSTPGAGTVKHGGNIPSVEVQAGNRTIILDAGTGVILAILRAGDMLGELSLIDSIGHSASAVTLENSLMLWMDKTMFNYMLDNSPRWRGIW